MDQLRSAWFSHSAFLALLGTIGVLTLTAVWHLLPAGHRLDTVWLDRISTQAPSSWLTWADTITTLGSFPVTIPLALGVAGYLWYRWCQRIALLWVGVFTSGQGVLYALKWLFGRDRPSAPGLLRGDFSFPSGHAFSAMLLYGAMLLISWPRWNVPWIRWTAALVTGGLIFAVGWSRLLLRVHYPTDVLGGFALGGIWLILFRAALRRWPVDGPFSSAPKSTH